MAAKLWKYAQLAEMWFTDIVRWVKIVETITEKWIRYTKLAKNVIDATEWVRALTSTERFVATWFKLWTSIIEWSAFHASSTMLNNTIAWNDLTNGIDPFWETIVWQDENGKPIKESNARWYLKSIAFLGIIKEIWWITQWFTQKFLAGKATQTEIDGVLKQNIILSAWKKIAINTASLWAEFVSKCLIGRKCLQKYRRFVE